MVRLKENKIDYVNFNPLSKFVSPHFPIFDGEPSFPVRGFVVQSGDHFRSWDHLRSNLGSFAGLYRPPFSHKIRKKEHCNKEKQLSRARRPKKL